MASSSKSKKIYDVFLSFRGTDLRNNFVGHLYHALHRIGIYTFRDSEELKKGDQILMLMKAIEESCIAIIVFSENYASSTWCLEEVAKIMECKEQNNLTVLPVFYKVDPREVRGGRDSYQRALAKHESKFQNDLEKVKRWKKVLADAGNLSGWHLNDGDESELIQEIVKEISTYLDRTPLFVAKHPVGIDSQVVKLKSVFDFKSDDGVLMLGLWGKGGIGKTSLARALYNAMFRQFEGACFLENVRETSKDNRGLVTLQEMLLNDILLPQQRLKVSNVGGGINLIRRRLNRKKVLLILDDVDDLRQLNTLLGEGKWFGNESRIIITTRNKHLLTCYGMDQVHVYEIKELDDSQAHELLTNHAFPTPQKVQIKKDLVDRIVNYAKGLPLALEVLGSFLHGRREHEWESTIKKLSRFPNNKINDVLKVSFDGLEENEKEIFLNVACFFKGRNSEDVKKVLDSCDLEAAIGLEILIEKSLISLEGGKLKVHDLIQSMGMDIVRQECRDNPRRRSRLWLYDDVVDVLSSDMGDCAIKAIVLEPPELKELRMCPNAFTKMRRLRLLILRNVHISFQDPISLPNELRWIEWAGCAPWNPQFSSGPKKLVGLNMGNCSVTGKQFKDFQQLKYLSLTDCNSLDSTPDLSCTPNLEKLHLLNCKSLVEAHESIAYHDKLQVLTIEGCSELTVFPNVLESKNLRDLRITNCMKFERFPDIPCKLEGLKEICLGGTAIKELPKSIENLISLESMDIYSCNNLVDFPSTIYKLQNIESLKICKCPIKFPKYEDSADPSMKIILPKLHELSLQSCNLSEVEFLENLSCFSSLRRLYLQGNNITSIPTSIGKRNSLHQLIFNCCHQLLEFPELPPYVHEVFAEGCKSLQTNGHLNSIDQCVRRWLTSADISSNNRDSSCSVRLPGEEMLEWLQPVEESSVSFMASRDFYDKFLGLVTCFVVSNDKAKRRRSVEISADVNGQSWTGIGMGFRNLEDRVALNYFPRHDMWRGVEFGQIDGRYAQFRFVVSGDVEKWGFRIICRRLKDDLKIAFRDISIDLGFLYEVDHEPIDPEVEISHICEGYPPLIDRLKRFQNWLMSTEEHSQRGSKRKHEFILPRGKRIKTMSTSSSTDGDENETRLIDLLESLHL